VSHDRTFSSGGTETVNVNVTLGQTQPSSPQRQKSSAYARHIPNLHWDCFTEAAFPRILGSDLPSSSPPPSRLYFLLPPPHASTTKQSLSIP